MRWLTVDLIMKIAIPLVTFLLGVVATLWMKKREAIRARNEAAVSEIARLAADWYQQVHKIDLDVAHPPDGFDPNREIENYISGRIILPALLSNREILLGRKAYAELISALDEFLQLFTTFDPRRQWPRFPTFESSGAECVRHVVEHRMKTGLPATEIAEADKRVQQISVLAARALK